MVKASKYSFKFNQMTILNKHNNNDYLINVYYPMLWVGILATHLFIHAGCIIFNIENLLNYYVVVAVIVSYQKKNIPKPSSKI